MLRERTRFPRNNTIYCVIRIIGNDEVGGPNPPSSSTRNRLYIRRLRVLLFFGSNERDEK